MRFMIVRAAPDTLVADPHMVGRNLGVRLLPKEQWREGTKMSRRYVPAIQAVAYHPDIAQAVKHGDLEQLGGYVLADGADDALAKSPEPDVKSMLAERDAADKRDSDERAAADKRAADDKARADADAAKKAAADKKKSEAAPPAAPQTTQS